MSKKYYKEYNLKYKREHKEENKLYKRGGISGL